MNKRKQKMPKFTPEEHERLMNRMVELMVDDIYRTENRSEKIKKAVKDFTDKYFLPEECLGVKNEVSVCGAGGRTG